MDPKNKTEIFRQKLEYLKQRYAAEAKSLDLKLYYEGEWQVKYGRKKEVPYLPLPEIIKVIDQAGLKRPELPALPEKWKMPGKKQIPAFMPIPLIGGGEAGFNHDTIIFGKCPSGYSGKVNGTDISNEYDVEAERANVRSSVGQEGMDIVTGQFRLHKQFGNYDHEYIPETVVDCENGKCLVCFTPDGESEITLQFADISAILANCKGKVSILLEEKANSQITEEEDLLGYHETYMALVKDDGWPAGIAVTNGIPVFGNKQHFVEVTRLDLIPEDPEENRKLVEPVQEPEQEANAQPDVAAKPQVVALPEVVVEAPAILSLRDIPFQPDDTHVVMCATRPLVGQMSASGDTCGNGRFYVSLDMNDTGLANMVRGNIRLDAKAVVPVSEDDVIRMFMAENPSYREQCYELLAEGNDSEEVLDVAWNYVTKTEMTYGQVLERIAAAKDIVLPEVEEDDGPSM